MLVTARNLVPRSRHVKAPKRMGKLHRPIAKKPFRDRATPELTSPAPSRDTTSCTGATLIQFSIGPAI